MVQLKSFLRPCRHGNSIAISGTHGKTTTTSMVSLILDRAKLSPTILVGGNLSEIGGNVKVGDSPYFVTEACEYMDSFLSLKPKMEIILKILEKKRLAFSMILITNLWKNGFWKLTVLGCAAH